MKKIKLSKYILTLLLSALVINAAAQTEMLLLPGGAPGAEGKIGEEKVSTSARGEISICHLSAGLFELSRIGDDTSGNDWDRTRKMGVNTLAFRSVQHEHFYITHVDCVGLTTKVPWGKNKQWMEFLAKSGTPLFISVQHDATGAKQKQV